MMSERQPRRGSAFTLIHLLAILPLVGFMLGLVMWGLRAQISTDRRILVQADRQAIMRSILNQLRADLVEAERIEFEKPRADQPVQPHLLEALVARFRGPSSRPADPPEKSPSWIMRLHGPGGTVRYLLYDRASATLSRRGTTLTDRSRCGRPRPTRRPSRA